MARFEELQMMLVEAATRYLDLYSLQVYTEQFTLDRESKLYLTIKDMEPPFNVTASVSYTFDAFQTGLSLFSEENDDGYDIDTVIDMDFKISLPILKDYPDILALYDEVDDMLEDTDLGLTIKEFIDSEGSYKEYEFNYTYEIDYIEDASMELFEEIFNELKDLMLFIYRKTERYIDTSWYHPEED